MGMKRLCRFLLASWQLGLTRLRGPRTVSRIEHPQDYLGKVTGITMRGYAIVIHCQRLVHHVQYQRAWIPNQRLTSYQVYASVSYDAPLALQLACATELTLSGLLAPSSFRKELLSHHVQAYVDLLAARITQQDHLMS